METALTENLRSTFPLGWLKSHAHLQSLTTVVGCLVVLGVLVHGVGTSHLGLYWDDTEFLMLGMHKVNGDATRFIFTDLPGLLARERPLQYFAWTMARAAFVAGLPPLHWMLAGLLILNAVVLAVIVHRIAGKAWFTFSAGVIFMVYPLSPLQAIWPSVIHYLWASLLAFLSILCCLNSVQKKKHMKWTVLAALSYLTSLLLHEGTALIPLTFVCWHLVSGKWRRPDTSSESATKESIYRPVFGLLSTLLVTLVMYTVWRKLILPLYGLEDYASSEVGFSPGIIANKMVNSAATILFPWVEALRQLRDWPPTARHVVLSAFLSVISGTLTFILIKHLAADQSDRSGSAQGLDLGEWFRITGLGFSLIAAGLVIIGISPLVPGSILGSNMFSRLYFAPMIGVAIALPALCLLAVGLFHSAPKLLSLSGLCGLLAFGFIFFPGSGNILTHRSELPQVLGRYSTSYALGVISYVLAVVYLAILSCLSLRSRILHFQGFVAATTSMVVLFGSLYQFSVKQQYVAGWHQQMTMLDDLRQIAPALKKDTFVIINDPQDHLAMSHSELSGYLVILYDSWSIMGNKKQYVHFYPDGVESTHYNFQTYWHPPEIIGPLTRTFIRGKAPFLARIPYDHLLTLEFDGTHLHMVPRMQVEASDATPLLIENHPERILNGPPAKTLVWSHLKG